MIKFNKLIILLILLIFSNKCNDKKDNQNITQFDFINVEVNKKNIVIPLNYKSIPQLAENRILKNINCQILFKIGSLEDSVLLSPIRVKTDQFENIYILDQGDCKVKKFNSNGDLTNIYGNKGKGPGEFIQPMRMDITNSSKILVSDAALNKCVVFNQGTPIEIKLNYPPISTCFLNDSIIGVLQINDLRQLSHIETYILNGEKKDETERILDIKDYNIPPFITSLIGEVISDYNQNLFYIPNYMNHIIAYKESKLVYSVKTIDKIKTAPTSTFITIPDGGFASSANFPDEQISSLNCGIMDDKIWIVSYLGLKKYNQKIIDFYSSKEGAYKYSYITNDIGSFTNIHISPTRIYVINPDGSVSVFQITINKS